jgi:hypothetical protein
MYFKKLLENNTNERTISESDMVLLLLKGLVKDGNDANDFHIIKGNLVHTNKFFYNAKTALKELKQLWSKGGYNYKFAKVKFPDISNIKIIDTSTHVAHSGDSGKGSFLDEGTVSVVLKITYDN